jgi:hypothetical protein
MCSIQKEVGAQWTALTEDEKTKYKNEAAPAWIEYFTAIGEPAKARKLANKVSGVVKRRRANLLVGGFVKKQDVNGKTYFHNETTGMASRTKVLLVADLLKPKVKSAAKGLTGWLVFRSVNAKMFSSDFKENSKEAGAAWKALSQEEQARTCAWIAFLLIPHSHTCEQEGFKKRAVILNASAAGAAPAAMVTSHAAPPAAAESSSSESESEDDDI